VRAWSIHGAPENLWRHAETEAVASGQALGAAGPWMQTGHRPMRKAVCRHSLQRLGLRIGCVLEFLAFKDNVGTQLRDEFRNADVEKNRVIDDRESANAFHPHRARHRNARRGVRVQSDNKYIGCICRQFQQAQMARMHDIEVARNESDARS